MSDTISALDQQKHEQLMTQQRNMALSSYQKAVSAYSNYIAQMASPERGTLTHSEAKEDKSVKKMLKRVVKDARSHWAGFEVVA